MAEPFVIVQHVSKEGYTEDFRNSLDLLLGSGIRATRICLDPEPPPCREGRSFVPYPEAQVTSDFTVEGDFTVMTIGIWLSTLDQPQSVEERLALLRGLPLARREDSAWCLLLQRKGIDALVSSAWAIADKVYGDAGAPDPNGKIKFSEQEFHLVPPDTIATRVSGEYDTIGTPDISVLFMTRFTARPGLHTVRYATKPKVRVDPTAVQLVATLLTLETVPLFAPLTWFGIGDFAAVKGQNASPSSGGVGSALGGSMIREYFGLPFLMPEARVLYESFEVQTTGLRMTGTLERPPVVRILQPSVGEPGPKEGEVPVQLWYEAHCLEGPLTREWTVAKGKVLSDEYDAEARTGEAKLLLSDANTLRRRTIALSIKGANGARAAAEVRVDLRTTHEEPPIIDKPDNPPIHPPTNPGASETWTPIGHANDVTAMAACADQLFAATRDNRLWSRAPVGKDINWEGIGEANDVIAMTATSEAQSDRPAGLYAVTGDSRLWWREPVPNIHWTAIGSAKGVVAMAAYKSRLYAATRDNQLLTRPASGGDAPWSRIGHADKVVAMTCENRMLFCVTSDGYLWWRHASSRDTVWTKIGLATDVVALASRSGKLFAATRGNKLLWRAALP